MLANHNNLFIFSFNMNIKFLLKRAIVFWALPILPVFFLSKYDNLDKLYNQDNNVASLQNKAKFDSLDILFIGNSYCYSGIIPAYFDSIGLKTYNLGIATAGPYFYEMLVNDYLAHCKQKPKSIYFLVSPTTFSLMSDNFLAYPIHRYINKNFSNEAITFKYNLYNVYLDMVQKSLKKGYTGIKENNNKIAINESLLLSKGFYKITDTCTETTIKNTQNLYLPLANDAFSQIKLKHLLNFAATLKSQNINLVFFDLPTFKLTSYFKASFLDDYSNAVSDLKKQFNFMSIDSNLSQNSFRNIDHLNFNGAKWVTKKMVNNISSK